MVCALFANILYTRPHSGNIYKSKKKPNHSFACPLSIDDQLCVSSFSYFFPFNQYNLSPFTSARGSHPFLTRSPLACLNVALVATLNKKSRVLAIRIAMLY